MMDKSTEPIQQSDEVLRAAIRVTFIVLIGMLLLACLFTILGIIRSTLTLQYPAWLLNCWLLADFLMLLLIGVHVCFYTLLLAQISGEVAVSLFIGTGIIVVPCVLGLFEMTSYYLPTVSVLSLIVLGLIAVTNILLIRGGICNVFKRSSQPSKRI